MVWSVQLQKADVFVIDDGSAKGVFAATKRRRLMFCGRLVVVDAKGHRVK
jgi:hypothetical protein